MTIMSNLSLRSFARHSVLATIGVVGLAWLAPRDASARLATSGEPSVSFTATGPAGMRFGGQSKDLTVQDDDTAIVVTVTLESFDTGITLRDKHMREKYLEVQKYPQAKLRVERSALTFPDPDGDASTDVRGQLDLHGQAHPITFHYTAKRGVDYAVSGTMRINMKDYGIEVPSYLGVTVKPDVDIEVKFHVVDR
jgi:polyisoprenoid-binding protein YceI